MEDRENDRRDTCARLFINQFQEVETGDLHGQEQGAVGGQVPKVPQAQVPLQPINPGNPANVQIVNEYNSFHLANITPPVAPKWKHPDSLLDEFHKFRRSCQRIFNGPMCHITSGNAKTSMLLICAGPNGEDIYDNFNLPPHLANDMDHVLQ